MLPVFLFCAQKGKVMAQQKRILVIDDERKMIESMQKLLSNEGYEVDIADGAQEGMALFETGSFDLVITDMMMPDYDGLYVMDTVRKHSADTPVIVVTGYGSMDSVIEAMRKGAYDYVIKPFDFDRIKATVRKVFDKQREQEEIIKQKRLEAISQTAVSLNHEINNPLCVISGTAELMLMKWGTSDGELKKPLEVILRNAARIQKITKKLAELIEPIVVEYQAGIQMIDVERSRASKE